MEALDFRLIKADEIDVRIGSINKGGVSLLLYKDARCDQNILDETVGPLNWQRHHSRENANCIVSIRSSETGEWVEKEDTGAESFTEKEKGLASDSFKRACFNWGIGRELYTAPEIFIFKSDLKTHAEKDGKWVCYDKFIVKNISYEVSQKRIKSVTIARIENGKEVAEFYFTNPSSPAATAATASATTPDSKEIVSPASNSKMEDDEILLFGNCKGKKYAEVKDTSAFKSFLNWVKKTTTTYPDPKQQQQYEKLKLMEV